MNTQLKFREPVNSEVPRWIGRRARSHLRTNVDLLGPADRHNKYSSPWLASQDRGGYPRPRAATTIDVGLV